MKQEIQSTPSALDIQLTSDNSKLQGKPEKVRVISNYSKYKEKMQGKSVLVRVTNGGFKLSGVTCMESH